MVIIMDGGRSISPRFCLGQAVALRTDPAQVGIVIWCNVTFNGFMTYSTSFAGNHLEFTDCELLEAEDPPIPEPDDDEEEAPA